MKRVIYSSMEYIEAMATIGSHRDPNFTVAVNPDSNRSGDCYFKYFDRESYSKAEHVARIDIRGVNRFYHRNRDGKKEWKLDKHIKQNLLDFLRQESDEWVGVSNWQSILYHWNFESHLIDEPFPKDKYSSKVEAFINGFYDDDEHLSDPSYVASYLEIPDYLNLSNS